MARMNSYTKATAFSDDDVVIIDGAKSGTRSMTVAQFKTLIHQDAFASAESGDTAAMTDIFIQKRTDGSIHRVTLGAIKTALAIPAAPGTITNAEIDAMF